MRERRDLIDIYLRALLLDCAFYFHKCVLGPMSGTLKIRVHEESAAKGAGGDDPLEACVQMVVS